MNHHEETLFSGGIYWMSFDAGIRFSIDGVAFIQHSSGSQYIDFFMSGGAIGFFPRRSSWRLY
jgi:hypothetical protein